MYLWSHKFRQALAVGIFLMLIGGLAFATNPPTPTPQPTATSNANAGAIAGAHSRSTSDSSATAMGGNSNVLANGGNSGGNTLSVESTYERSAPGVGQGSLYIPACGAGANAGGSNTSGAAFLGAAWTPKDCKLLLSAAAFQSLGMYDAACEMVLEVSAVKAYYKDRADKPSCKERKPESKCCVTPPQSVGAIPDLSAYMTRAEGNERIDRAFKSTAGK